MPRESNPLLSEGILELSRFTKLLSGPRLVIALLVLPSGCDRATEPAHNPLGIRPEWISAALQGSLEADGRFIADSLSFNLDSGITASRAETLAMEFVQSIRTRAGNIAAALESEHGGPINFESLRRCGRTIYGKSPFRSPSASVPIDLQNILGGQFVITMCVGDTPTIWILVAARTPVTRGSSLGATSDLVLFGIPLHRPVALHQAEDAVRLVATRFRVRVDSIPRAAMDIYGIGQVGSNGRPSGLLWRVHLAEPRAVVRVATGVIDTVDVMYVVAGFARLPFEASLAGTREQLTPFKVRSTVASSTDSLLVVPTEPVLFELVAAQP